jgi:hypothetical protein
MNDRLRAWLFVLLLPVLLVSARAQTRPAREFPEFRGTWVLDERAGAGHITGLPVVRTIEITTTPTEISLKKDSGEPEVYRFDGTETKTDRRTGAVLDQGYSFTLVAGTLALTSKRIRRNQSGQTYTNIITDAYSVSDDVLTVERQLSVLIQPPGTLATLEDPNNNRQTLVYRRKTNDAPR